jgi:amidase
MKKHIAALAAMTVLAAVGAQTAAAAVPDLERTSTTELAAMLKAGDLTSVELTKAYRKTSTSPGCRRPHPRSCSSIRFPDKDAFVVQRLKAAGAAILGKANLTEFAAWVSNHQSSGNGSLHGVEPVRHVGRLGWFERGLRRCRRVRARRADASLRSSTSTARRRGAGRGRRHRRAGPGVGGTVPATLSLTLGAPATFGPLVPGVASDALRTGAYSKTLTFTLSTTNP